MLKEIKFEILNFEVFDDGVVRMLAMLLKWRRGLVFESLLLCRKWRSRGIIMIGMKIHIMELRNISATKLLE